MYRGVIRMEHTCWWQRGLTESTAHARVPSQKESAFTTRREQLESVSSTRESSVDICSRLLPLDERLYLAPSASEFGKKLNQAQLHKELQHRKMRPNETVFQYLVAIRELANRGQGFSTKLQLWNIVLMESPILLQIS
ncbi:hypothetical protein TNCV_24871 [Trichonephila clavipes]|uniref:Uncharacterized protein n=1 Tax=Trichonephila clavipes TaxID=2585209 RepID=A0A8X6W1C2_TRICX|nr:hypothetical protein TNCV_24871 [Trichonephila clavipes]